MLLNRPGRFRGNISEAGIGESGSNKLTCWTPRIDITEEWIDGAWRDVSAEGAEITAFMYLEKIDGTINETTKKSIIDAIGWDGRNVSKLQADNIGMVQVTVVMDSYTGTPKAKVQWMNHYDSEGGGGSAVIKSAPADLKRLESKLGAKLRATAGAASPAPAGASAPAGPPKPPVSPPKAAPKPPPPVASQGITMEEAWVKFYGAAKETGLEDIRINQQWSEMIAATGKGENDLTGADWASIAAHDFKAAGDLPF